MFVSSNSFDITYSIENLGKAYSVNGKKTKFFAKTLRAGITVFGTFTYSPVLSIN